MFNIFFSVLMMFTIWLISCAVLSISLRSQSSPSLRVIIVSPSGHQWAEVRNLEFHPLLTGSSYTCILWGTTCLARESINRTSHHKLDCPKVKRLLSTQPKSHCRSICWRSPQGHRVGVSHSTDPLIDVVKHTSDRAAWPHYKDCSAHLRHVYTLCFYTESV